VTIVRGLVDVSQNHSSGPAGSVYVLGSYVGLFDNAQVYAAAALGGGTVLIGGDYQGSNAAVRNAARTYVGPNAVIRADAQTRGDGGKVVVWAEEVTRFYGTISARGGNEAGNGGFAEVSGKNALDYGGFTDLTAAHGERGTLLLDPKNITIENGGADAIATNNEFAESPAADRSFDASLIVAALAGANVELQANNDITIDEAIDATGNNNPGNLTLRAGRSVIINANVAIEGTLTITANDPGVALVTIPNRDAGNAQITVLAGVTLDTSDTNGNIILQYGNGPNGNDATGAMTVGILDAGTGAITLNTTANDGGAASVENITVASVSAAGALTIVNSAATTFTGAVTAGTVTITDTTGTVAFQGVTAITTLVTANQGYNVAFTGATTTVTNDTNFLNTGTVTLGNDAADVTTFTGGVATTGNASNPSATNLAGSIVTANAAIDFGAVTLTAATVIDTNATTAAGDITLGAVSGGGFDLTLETGAGIAGADVSGTSVSGVNSLALQNIGGTATFTGAITASTLAVPATVNNISLTGTGSTVNNAVAFANTGTLVLGQAAGAQNYNGGVSTTAVGGTVTINGTIATTNDPITFGPVTLGSEVVLDTNAASAAGDITLGAVSGGGFDLTLETGAGIAGADVSGTSVSGVDVLALQNIGGTASFTGALTVATLTVPGTVNNVSLTGTGSTVTNAVAFANAGTLVLGQAGGTQNYNGGVSTTAVGGTVTINGTIATTNDPITFGAVTLGSDATLDTNATSAAGDITLGVVTGGGFDLTLETGAAVAGADVTGTSVSGVDVLALQNIGGTASFTGPIAAATLTVPATVNNVSLTGSGTVITNAVAFANTGTLVLGQAAGTQTYNGGVSTVAVGGTVTVSGTIATSNDAITLGPITLGSSVVLNSAGGAITTGAIEGTATTDDLTITSVGGAANTVTVGAIGAGGNVNTVLITADNTITLGGNITTSNAAGNTVTLQAPTINMVAFTIDTNNAAFDGDVTFITNLLQNPGAVDAGTATFRISPFTATHVIEFAANNSATIVENAFYDSDFANIVAGQFIIGGALQTGDINIGNDLAALTFNFNLTVQTAGMILVNSDYTSAGGDLTLISGAGVTYRDLTLPDDMTTTVNLGAGEFEESGNATLADNLVAITAGGGITFNNNIDADNAAANDRALSLNSSTTGTISVLGNVGAGQALAGLTIVHSNGATFTGSVNVTDSAAGTITIVDTVAGQTVAFQGNLSADLLVVNAGTGNYNVAITGAVNSIGGMTTFNNGGTVTLGNEATDSTTFANGVTAIAPSAVNIAGAIAATNAASAITLGDANTGVTVTANATVGGAATGAIDLGDATINNGVTLTVGTGNSNQINLDTVSGVAAGAPSNLTLNTTGVVTVAEAVGTDIGTVMITQSGGTTFQSTVDAASVAIIDTVDGQTVAFQGNLTAGALAANNAGADNYNVEITGAANSIGGTTTFANGGSLTLGNDATDTTTFIGGVTATAPSAINIAGTVAATAGTSTITLGDANTGVTVTDDATVGGTATGAIDLGDATINDGLTLTVGAGAANAISLDAVSGVVGGLASNLTLNTTGIVTVAEAVGTDIGTVTITQSGGTTFQDAFTATNAVLTNTAGGQTIAFEGVTSITNLTTANQGYNVAFRGSSTTIANDASFVNTGNVTLGDGAGDTILFDGGVNTFGAASNPSVTNVFGIVRTSGDQLDFGATALQGAAVIDTTNAGANLAGAALNLQSVAGGGNALDLNSGIAGAITVFGATDAVSALTIIQSNGTTFQGTVGAVTPGAVTIQDTQNGQTVAFQAATNITTLTTTGEGYNVSFTGPTTNVAGDTNFLNTGTLTLGDNAGDSATFAGGLATIGNATNPTQVDIAGTVATVDNRMDLGAITLTADSVLDTGTAAASVMNVGAVTSGGNSLTLDSGPNAAADITVASFAGNGNLTVVDSGGTTFTGTVTSNIVTLMDTTGAIAFRNVTTITALNTMNPAYDVEFTGSTTTITNDTSFVNTGTVRLGDQATDVILFNGGVNTFGAATNPTLTNVFGVVRTSGDDLDFGSTALVGNSVIDTTNNGGTAAGAGLDMQSINGGGSTLDLNSGTTGAIGVASTADNISTLTIIQSNGATFAGPYGVVAPGVVMINDTEDGQTVAFQDDTRIITLGTAAQGYNVAFTGDTTTVTNDPNFQNSGIITLGNDAGDNTTFEMGVTATTPTLVEIAGGVRASVGASTITLGDANTGVMVTNDATVGGSATGLIDMGDATINDGRLLTVGTGIGNAINLDAISGVAGGAMSNVTIDTTSNATVSEAVGTDIETMRIVLANNFTAMNTIDAQTLVQEDGTGTTDLQGNVTTSTTNVVTNAIRLHNVQVLATSTTAGALTLDAAAAANYDLLNALLTTGDGGITSGGQISDQVLARDGSGQFTALNNSVNTGIPIFGISGTGTILVEVTDSNGRDFTVAIDWLEGVGLVLDPVGAVTERFVQANIDGTPPLVNAESFSHLFQSVPAEATAGGFVPVPVSIFNFAGGTIRLNLNGQDLLVAEGIDTIVNVPFVGSSVVTILPIAEALPSAPEAPPTFLGSFEFQSQPVQRGNTTFIESTGGGVVQSEERYYELRIVSFDENGNLVETPTEQSIRLDDPKLKAIAPFDPSKLPALFGRLPPDRYRIYLIEDGTERLILDFVIEQGQPVEVPESFEGDLGGAALGPAETIEDNSAAVPAAFESDPESRESEIEPVSIDVRRSARIDAAESFAERFAEASFLSHGGMVVGAAALAATTAGRWEKSMDRVMEQFGRRRPFTRRRRRVTYQSNGADDTAPKLSLSLKD
jgi:hypothetical protein